MYRVELKKIINFMMSLFYCLGMWHRGDEATVRETGIKLFLSFYYLLFPMLLMAGAIFSYDNDESIYLTQASIMSAVISIKAFFIIWNKKLILEMLNQCGVYTVENRGDFNLVKNTLQKFDKLIVALLVVLSVSGLIVSGYPFLGSERNLFLNIAFPLDWKNNEIAYWLVNAFMFTELFLTFIVFLSSVIIWYLMLNCALRYKILGNQIRNMGVIKTVEIGAKKRKISEKEKQIIFLRDLIAAIDTHQQIREYCTFRCD